MKKNYDILNKILEDYQIYLRDKKIKKIKRDDKDYRDRRIYTFAHKYYKVKVSGEGKRQ